MKQLLLLYFTILLHGFLTAQSPVFHHINDENGLPSNEIYSIVQDHNGFIWIGCSAGLFRYNGIKFIQYQNAHQKSSIITGLTISADSVLYCYNFSNQIFFVKDDSLHEITSWHGKRDRGFTNIAIDAEDRLWCCSANYLYNYDRKKQTWDSVFLSSNNIYAASNIVSTNSRKRIWSSLYKNIISVDTGTLTSHVVEFNKNDYPGLSSYYFVPDDTILWLFSLNGESIYNNVDGDFKPYKNISLISNLKGKKITYIKVQGQYLFIATYSGFIIHNLQSDESTLFFEKESFSNYLRDTEGNVWLTTLQNGIYFIPEMDFKVWNKQQTNSINNKITDLYSSKQAIYFSMLNGNIGVLNKLNAIIKNYYIGIKSDIRTIFFDSLSNSVLFNTSEDLFQLKDEKVSILRRDQPPLKKIIRAGNNYVFCTSFGTDIYYRLNVKNKPKNITEEWSRDAAYLEEKKLLFIATNNGLLRGRLVNDFFEIDTLFDRNVLYKALFTSENSQKVVALNFKGIIYEIGDSHPVKVAILPSHIIPTDIVVYKSEYIVSTNKGLWIFNRDSTKWTNINNTSGLISNDIISLEIDSNLLWIATSKGLQSIPIGFKYLKPLPQVILRKVIIDGINTEANLLNIKYNSTLQIFAEAISFSSLGNYKFAYRISLSDTNWRFCNPQDESIVISGIPTGNFELEIKAVDYLGRFSGNVILLKGKVIPPFWHRWWFYIVIALSGIMVTYFIFHQRIKYLRRKQLQAIEELKLQNELNLLQQTALKAQMNPHFLFNVLNSIKSFIYENDKKSAAEYLSKFAELVRGVLETSSLPMVKLSHEINALELYIQLEAMSLHPPFEYFITIDEAIDTEAILIPSLIIQPYIENAFKHGLRHKQGDKKLQINMAWNNSTHQLKIIITDNGIGRKKSAEINSTNKTAHQSFATNANAKRLALLNSDTEIKASVVFEDITDNWGNANGTIVVLNIKV